ncbi:MAG: hypothetical protein IJU98_06910 [Synergistaceae bacterium]|nr:hypothetical protein [Synergistaceae bacterium]
MKLRKFLFGAGLALCLSLGLASAVLAANPEDALSACPEKSVTVALRLEDVGGLLRWLASEATLKTLAPAVGLDEGTIKMVSAMLEKVPVKSVALLAGITAEGTRFCQAAIAGPETANVGEFLLGAGSEMAPMAEETLKESGLAFEMKDGLLLLGMTPDSVKASVEALEDESKRLSLTRKFATKDFTLFHVDMDAVKAIALAQAEDDEARKTVEESFKEAKEYLRAPMKVEFGFESFADRFLVAMGMNLREAMTEKYAKALDEAQPVAGGHIRLLGEGSPLFALGTKIDLDALREHPSVKEGWQELIGAVKSFGFSEKDVLDFLSGGLSLVLGGGTVAFEGLKFPAVYLTQEGKNGVASAFTDTLAQREKAHLNPIQAEGWDKMLQLDSSISPVSCLIGTRGENFFIGAIDAASLAEAPAPSDRLAKLLAKESIGTLFFDFEAIQAYLKGAEGPLGMLLSMASMMTGSEEISAIGGSIKDVLDAKLSVPSFSVWGPDVETIFMDFANVEVPPEEGLWAKLVKAYLAFNEAEEKEDGEEKKD